MGSLFGNPRSSPVGGPEAYRSLKRPSSVPAKADHHYTPLQATHTTKVYGQQDSSSKSQTTNHHTKNDHKTTKRTIEPDSKSTAKQRFKTLLLLPRPPSSSQATTHRHAIAPAHGRPPGTTGIESRQAKSLGWRSGSPKAHPYHPAPTARPAGQSQRRLLHTSNPAAIVLRVTRGRTPSDEHPTEFSAGEDPAAPSGTATLLRLCPNHEPHLRRLHPAAGLGPPASVPPTFMTLTGGVYKARTHSPRRC